MLNVTGASLRPENVTVTDAAGLGVVIGFQGTNYKVAQGLFKTRTKDFYLFTYLESEQEAGGAAEGAPRRAPSHAPKTVTRAKIRGRTLRGPHHPGVPGGFSFLCFLKKILFIYLRKRGRARAQAGEGQREGGKQAPAEQGA